jgi:hypothetical protein
MNADIGEDRELCSDDPDTQRYGYFFAIGRNTGLTTDPIQCAESEARTTNWAGYCDAPVAAMAETEWEVRGPFPTFTAADDDARDRVSARSEAPSSGMDLKRALEEFDGAASKAIAALALDASADEVCPADAERKCPFWCALSRELRVTSHPGHCDPRSRDERFRAELRLLEAGVRGEALAAEMARQGIAVAIDRLGEDRRAIPWGSSEEAPRTANVTEDEALRFLGDAGWCLIRSQAGGALTEVHNPEVVPTDWLIKELLVRAGAAEQGARWLKEAWKLLAPWFGEVPNPCPKCGHALRPAKVVPADACDNGGTICRPRGGQ